MDNEGQWYVGSVTLFDLGARYTLNSHDKAIALRLNIENLTNEAYWISGLFNVILFYKKLELITGINICRTRIAVVNTPTIRPYTRFIGDVFHACPYR